MTVDLHFGDNLEWLRRLPAGIVDLCYIDPPFNSQADYNIIVGGAQVKAFGDTWSWDIEDVKTQLRLLIAEEPVSRWSKGMMLTIGSCGMFSYLLFMAERLIEIKRVLKSTGSIYVHCDKFANFHIRLLMNAVFGPENFRNEIVWCYSGGGTPHKDYPRKHDTLLRYTKTDNYNFNVEYRPYSAGIVPMHSNGEPLDLKRGTPVTDWWTDIKIVTPFSAARKEKIGYPTQKPLALLERIILASSNPGDMVMDCFMGSGTTGVAAVKNGRNFMGCDITFHAVDIAMDRLKGMDEPPEVTLTGHPETLDDARELATHDRFQFQAWALDMVECNPSATRTAKRGKDSGIDGRQVVILKDNSTYTTIVSVKSGKPRPGDLRDLVGTVSREKAQRGVLLMLDEPTGDMVRDAATVGIGDHGEAKCIVLTAQDLLDGKKIPIVQGGKDEMP